MDTLHEDRCTFVIMTGSVLLRMINISEKKSFRENQNIQFMYNNLVSENCVVY
jgi:hypothetical protein